MSRTEAEGFFEDVFKLSPDLSKLSEFFFLSDDLAARAARIGVVSSTSENVSQRLFVGLSSDLSSLLQQYTL